MGYVDYTFEEDKKNNKFVVKPTKSKTMIGNAVITENTNKSSGKVDVQITIPEGSLKQSDLERELRFSVKNWN